MLFLFWLCFWRTKMILVPNSSVLLGRGSPIPRYSLDTSRVSYSSTQCWHCLPGESIRSHRLRAQPRPRPCQVPASCPGCYLCSWLKGCKSEVPLTTSLNSTNLLKQLTELRETFYLLDHWFIIKGCNSGTDRWKRYTGQDTEKGYRASVPFSWIFMCSSTWKVSGSCILGSHRVFIIQVQLIK